MATGTVDSVSRSLETCFLAETLRNQTITFSPARPFTEDRPKEHPQPMTGTADQFASMAIIAIPVQAPPYVGPSAPDSAPASA
jgi:hypothetical protein